MQQEKDFEMCLELHSW